jgi:hypothetical protein
MQILSAEYARAVAANSIEKNIKTEDCIFEYVQSSIIGAANTYSFAVNLDKFGFGQPELIHGEEFYSETCADIVDILRKGGFAVSLVAGAEGMHTRVTWFKD